MYKKIPFISFVVKPRRKAKINLSGCNFNCKGCFAIAKQEVGKSLSVDELIKLFTKSCRLIYGEQVDDVQMTGGEPTINADYLLSLIQNLKKLHINKIGISTNGYLLDRNLIKKLKFLNVDYIKLDLKAYSDKIHSEYTGKSNANVLRAVNLLHHYNLNFYVRTIFMPDVIDFEEIEKIARFIGKVDRSINYKIYQFAPEQLDKKVSRPPTDEEMRKAYSVAKRYLDNVEFYTTKTAYKPAPYKCIEVRADNLLNRFKKIDKISKSVIADWDMEYFTMNQILNLL